MATFVMDRRQNIDTRGLKEIARQLGIPVFVDEPLKDYTTLGVGGSALVLFPKTVEQIAKLVSTCNELGIQYRSIGWGSNLIISDGPLDFVIISLKEFGKVLNFHENELEVSANHYMPRLVRKAMERSLAGLEELGGIPGTVGGMLRMNAGAYGTEMKDVVRSATVVSPRHDVKQVEAKDLQFSYRHSSIQPDEIVLYARLILHPDAPRAIAQRVRLDRKERKASQPLNEKSAGCIFKNPTDREGNSVPAGKIIEELKLKGKSIGGAVISEKHGNFIVNRHQATSDDVFKLIDSTKERVYKETGLSLQEEVEIWR